MRENGVVVISVLLPSSEMRPAHVRLHDGEPVRLRPAVAAKEKVL